MGAWGHEHGPWEREHGGGTVRHFFLLSFVKRNFLWRRDNEAIFFWFSFARKFFDGDGTVRHFLSFVNMGMGAWRWDSVAIFFWFSFYHHT